MRKLFHHRTTRAVALILVVACVTVWASPPATAGQRLTNQISDNTGPLRTEQYGYDSLSRLTSVNYGDGQTQGYTFDPMGNRLTKTDNVNGNDTYTYNAANMLLTRNMGSYTNDANGNTLTGGGRTNTWDGQNRLTQCVYNGTTTNHTYGADGLRRRTVEGMNTTDFVLAGPAVIRSLLNGSVDRTYLNGPRGPEYERVGANAPIWYLYDGLGSVLGTVDGSGNIVSTRKYDAYGLVRGSTGPSGTKHKWVGGLGHPSEAETGLVYMQARYYDPLNGRFANEDPRRDGRNWFEYAYSSPTNVVDDSGCAGLKNPGAFGLAAIGGYFGVLFGLFSVAMAGMKEYVQAKGYAALSVIAFGAGMLGVDWNRTGKFNSTNALAWIASAFGGGLVATLFSMVAGSEAAQRLGGLAAPAVIGATVYGFTCLGAMFDEDWCKFS